MHWLIVGPHSHSYQMVCTRELRMRYIVFIIYILINMCISNIRVNFNSSIGELMPVDLALKAILGSIATNPGKHAGVWFVGPFPDALLLENCHSYIVVIIGIDSTQEKPMFPSLTLVFPLNNSFVVHDPFFLIYGMEVGTILLLKTSVCKLWSSCMWASSGYKNFYFCCFKLERYRNWVAAQIFRSRLGLSVGLHFQLYQNLRRTFGQVLLSYIYGL